jgi:hypothetical protein
MSLKAHPEPREEQRPLTPRTDAQELQRQMAEIRSQLQRDVREVVQGAKSASDWRSYIRSQPWIALSLAFAAGYLVVPSRVRTIKIAAGATHDEPRALEAAAPPPKKSGRNPVLGWVVAAVAPLAVRAAQNYALNWVENLLANQATPHRQSRAAAPPPFAATRK